MFLAELNHSEKKTFCKLANHLACIDGVVSDDELDMLQMYNQEMNFNYTFQPKISENLENIALEMVNSSLRTKKIVCFELLGLAYADADYSEVESKMINRLCEIFGISVQIKETLNSCVYQIMETYKALGNILDSD